MILVSLRKTLSNGVTVTIPGNAEEETTLATSRSRKSRAGESARSQDQAVTDDSVGDGEVDFTTESPSRKKTGSRSRGKSTK